MFAVVSYKYAVYSRIFLKKMRELFYSKNNIDMHKHKQSTQSILRDGHGNNWHLWAIYLNWT